MGTAFEGTERGFGAMVAWRAGAIRELDPDLSAMRTWYAGDSVCEECSNLNERAIGIEQEHAAVSDDWPDAQIRAEAIRCAWIVESFGLDLSTDPIVSHARVALPPGREHDPHDYRWDVFRREMRQPLGEESSPVRLIWGLSAQGINVPINLIGESALANAAALSAATGLSVLAHRRKDGMVEIRRFFESHGFRVEWDAGAKSGCFRRETGWWARMLITAELSPRPLVPNYGRPIAIFDLILADVREAESDRDH